MSAGHGRLTRGVHCCRAKTVSAYQVTTVKIFLLRSNLSNFQILHLTNKQIHKREIGNSEEQKLLEVTDNIYLILLGIIHI